jgi:archaellum component FlaC
MLSYEIENKLREKVDKYELYNLQSDIRQLKDKVTELSNNVFRLSSTIDGVRTQINEILVTISNSTIETLIEDINNIRRNL